jgi:hypothetical protein
VTHCSTCCYSTFSLGSATNNHSHRLPGLFQSSMTSFDVGRHGLGRETQSEGYLVCQVRVSLLGNTRRVQCGKMSRFRRRQFGRDDCTRASDVTDDGAGRWNKRPRVRMFQQLGAALYPRVVQEMEGDGAQTIFMRQGVCLVVASMLVRPRRINCPTGGDLQRAVTRGVGGGTHVEAGMQH